MRNPTLKVKWARLCRDFGVELSQEENELLWKLRSKRNQEIHGAGADTKREDVYRALNMVERVVLARIANLTQ